MLRSWLSHQHALDATPWAFYNVTLNKVLMHLVAMLLTFSCSFQHTLDASWCDAPDFLINTFLMLRPWLSTMSLWTWSWCILMLCSWISHVASNTILVHLDATLLTFSQHALDATPWAFYNVTLNKVLMHLDAMLLNFSCSFQHALHASWCYAPDFLINTLLMLRPWLSTMSLWTRSWCILLLCS